MRMTLNNSEDSQIPPEYDPDKLFSAGTTGSPSSKTAVSFTLMTDR